MGNDFRCPVCNLELPDEATLRKHVRSIHRCPSCGTMCRDYEALQMHIITECQRGGAGPLSKPTDATSPPRRPRPRSLDDSDVQPTPPPQPPPPAYDVRTLPRSSEMPARLAAYAAEQKRKSEAAGREEPAEEQPPRRAQTLDLAAARKDSDSLGVDEVENVSPRPSPASTPGARKSRQSDGDVAAGPLYSKRWESPTSQVTYGGASKSTAICLEMAMFLLCHRYKITPGLIDGALQAGCEIHPGSKPDMTFRELFMAESLERYRTSFKVLGEELGDGLHVSAFVDELPKYILTSKTFPLAGVLTSSAGSLLLYIKEPHVYVFDPRPRGSEEDDGGLGGAVMLQFDKMAKLRIFLEHELPHIETGDSHQERFLNAFKMTIIRSAEAKPEPPSEPMPVEQSAEQQPSAPPLPPPPEPPAAPEQVTIEVSAEEPPDILDDSTDDEVPDDTQETATPGEGLEDDDESKMEEVDDEPDDDEASAPEPEPEPEVDLAKLDADALRELIQHERAQHSQQVADLTRQLAAEQAMKQELRRYVLTLEARLNTE